jgi:putative transcriptional regulator
MDNKVFSGLLAATKEALSHYKGEKLDLRTTELPEAPEPMSRAEIKRLRERLKVSQPVFARCLNVSTKLVQAWEGGVRHPDGAALRLLRIVEQAPVLVLPGTAKPGATRFRLAGRKKRVKVAS